jgi:hypothetical protein
VREILFVARHAIARAHPPRIELAAVAVVLAHLDGVDEARRRVATGGKARDFQGLALKAGKRTTET